MSSAMDVIKILIEADSTGLETQLKRATDTVVNTVNKMNSKQVNWETIMAKTISPTLIAGVASVFAHSIAQFMSFQNAAVNLNNIGGKATNSFANSLGQVSGKAYSLAMGAGQSIRSTAVAWELFHKAGLSGAAASDAVTRASQISYATGKDYLSVVQELVRLFNQWGLTSTPQVEHALVGLTNAAKNGRFTFSELVQAISKEGPILRAKTNINDVAISLATLSTKSGLAKSTIINTFTAISNATGKVGITMNAVFGGAAKAISDGPNGLITSFKDIEKSAQKMSPLVATIFGQQVGIMKNDIISFKASSVDAFTKAGDAAQALHKKMTPLNTIIKNNTSITRQLEKSYKNFWTEMDKYVLPPALTALNDILTSINGALEAVGSGKVSWKQFFQAVPSGAEQVGKGIVGAAINFGKGGENAMIGMYKATGLPPLIQPINSGVSGNTTSNSINTITNNIHMNGNTSNPHILAGDITDKMRHNQIYGLQ